MKKILIILLFPIITYSQNGTTYSKSSSESIFLFTSNLEASTYLLFYNFLFGVTDTLLCDSVEYLDSGNAVKDEIPYLYRVNNIIYYDIYKWKWRLRVLKKPTAIIVKAIYFPDIGWQNYQ